MIHRITLRSNPRLLLLGLLIAGLPLGGLFLAVYLRSPIGIAALLGAGYVSYQFIRFLIPLMQSRIESSEEGITCHFSGKDPMVFHWKMISHAGLCRQKWQKPCLFLYQETNDQFVIIPQEFSHFEHLADEVRKKTPYQEIRLERDDTLQRWLKDQLDRQKNS